MTRAWVVGGTHSGVGKTTVALGLMAALKRRGLAVQAFKVGPDFLDPLQHTQVTGRPSRNLDGWMLSRETNQALFTRQTQGMDGAVIEGVMGLYDGSEGCSEAGSTAQMAKWLGVPVVLVVDASALSRSVAAVVKGFTELDTGVSFAGVILNRVAGQKHFEDLKQAIRAFSSVPVLGGLPREETVRIGERHLGLYTPHDLKQPGLLEKRLADWIEPHLDWDCLMRAAAKKEKAAAMAGIKPEKAHHVRIGIARDAAFCFYYEDNLDLLREAGADLIPFSPLQDRLPLDLDALYLGGGYPELYARELSQNQALLEDIRQFAGQNRMVYGECGGLMYLSQGIENRSAQRFPLCGVLSFWTRMSAQYRMSYCTVYPSREAGFFPAGQALRGHVFHYSEMIGEPAVAQVYEVITSQSVSFREGYRAGNVLASYVHLHFGSHPEAARTFVAACRRSREEVLR